MKVFDYLVQELSLSAGENLAGGPKRYDLWTSMALNDAHPMHGLTSEQAATYLEEATGPILERLRKKVGPKEWAKLVKRIRRFNPDHPTPEETLQRILGGRPD